MATTKNGAAKGQEDMIYRGKRVAEVTCGSSQADRFASCDDTMAVKVFSRPKIDSSNETDNFLFRLNCRSVSYKYVSVAKFTFKDAAHFLVSL